jgi:23S rRNA (cytosine1962-C5)-methyltransferase
MNIEGPVVVSRKGQARIERGHPWVFRSDVVTDGGASPGAVVRVADVRGTPLGFAFWSSRSEIRLRMIERSEALAEGFLRDRIERALRWRETVAAGAEAYRVVHGEGDGLPSLVVDRYGDYVSIQTLSQGTERAKAEVVAALVDLLKPKGIVERNDPRVRTLEGLEQAVSVLHGEVPDAVEVSEGDVRFRVDLRKGQKTGLFLDQRENHLAARQYARGRVLDCFTYDGGFALQVARQADDVTAVDLSAESLERVKANAAVNGFSNVTARDANVFDLLHDLDHFEAILADSAVDARATVTVVEKRRQARDHPVVLGVPETYYLKCFVLRRLE